MSQSKPSGLSAALGHEPSVRVFDPEPFGSEPLGHELEAEWLKADLLMAEGSTKS